MNIYNYNARITTKTPSAFIFMIDQSGSMSEPTQLDGIRMSKAEAVSVIISSLIEEIMSRCKRDGGYKDYLHFVVLGYSGGTLRSVITGDVDNCTFLTPSQLANIKKPVKTIERERILPNGEKTVSVTHLKQWVKPEASNTTPMLKAFETVYKLCSDWTKKYKDTDCFPPIIINITDGEASDGSNEEIIGITERIKELGTNNGKTLLFNIHTSSDMDAQTVNFPASPEELPCERYADLLFRISSEIPEIYHEQIENNLNVKIDSRGVRALSYNADMANVLKMINIGSISINFIG